ncbi:MAG: XRE family transcriptional regulator [Proteobacteria bacterium]|nr:XRE family transcriptional regulator [Pseudomonadota bacterium]
MTNDPQITPSSGNVFADLNLDEPDELLAKADLAIRICEAISRRRLSQTRAAALLGVDQPKISALMHGRLEGFSTERLFRFLNALDLDVEIVIRPKRSRSAHGGIHVAMPSRSTRTSRQSHRGQSK